MNGRIPAYEGNDKFIFVSYAHKNSEKVMPIIEALFNDKYRVWYDEGIAPGSEWPKNIADHLKAASAVLVFISNESISSINCENEVANSRPNERNVYVFSLDGSSHKLLNGCKLIKDYEELRNNLDNDLIGDGVTGYERKIGKAKKGNYWTALLVLVGLLIVGLIASIYGLNAGWFNNLLPGLKQNEIVEEKPKDQIVEVNDNILTDAITGIANGDYFLEPIIFKSNETKDIICKAIDFKTSKENPLTLEDLANNLVTELIFENVNGETLRYIKYFPNLKEVTFIGGDITNINMLLECPSLETVKISKDIFPIDIPQNKQFVVEYLPYSK